MIVEERLASLDSNMEALNNRLTDHTSQDDTNFSRLSDQLIGLDEKIDQLLIREAAREGELKGIWRSTIAVAGTISLVIAVIGLVIPFYVGG